MYLAVIALAWLVFHTFMVGFATGPLEGSADVGGWEYSGYFLAEKLSWDLVFKIDFFSNETFYPLGATAVYQAWGLERDFLYALAFKSFGHGAWLVWYYSLAQLMTAIFAFYLVKPYFDQPKALLASLIIPFFNAYGINKFPGHFGIAICHWSLLSVLVDFLLWRELVLRKKIVLKLVAVRFALTFLSLGQELGYVAPLSLSSAMITILALVGFWFLSDDRQELVADFSDQIRRERLFLYLSVVIGLVAAYVYVPILLQIVAETSKHESDAILSGAWWAHPRRLFEPFFFSLGINYHDNPEGFAALQPGWFLLGLGVWGLLTQQKSLLVYGPFLVFLGLICIYHPTDLPSLKVFPWFKYARVGPRATLIFSTLFAIFMLGASLPKQRSEWLKWSLTSVLALIGIFELAGIYRAQASHAYQNQDLSLLREFGAKIAQHEGEAVLNWPFCVMGGNGGGPCPKRETMGDYAFRKYHGKKVMGAYFGRLRSEDAHLYRSSGIEALLETQGKRCLNHDELRFLKSYYDAFSFAGLLLRLDSLPSECHSDFKGVFGVSSLLEDLPPYGRLAFFPKVDRSKENRQRGLELSYVLPREFSRVQKLIKRAYGRGSFETHGFSLPRGTDRGKGTRRYHVYAKTRNKIQANGTLLYEDDWFEVYRSAPVKCLSETSIDLSSRLGTAQRFNVINENPLEEPGYLYTHPGSDPAELSFSMKKPFTRLSFGLWLKNTTDGVRYIVRADQMEVFSITLDRPAQLNHLCLELNASRDLSFVVDPLGTNASDWAYWRSPLVGSR